MNSGGIRADLNAGDITYKDVLIVQPFANTLCSVVLTGAELKEYEGAIKDYDKAIELDPNYALAYMNRGIAKAQLKQYSAAIADYDKAIELDPNFALAYHNRGVAKYNLAQYNAAIADYDKAIELEPNFAPAYYARGLIYREL